MSPHKQRSERQSDSPGRSPEPAEIRKAREAAGLDPRQCATLVHRAAHWWLACEAGERRMDQTTWDHWRLLAVPTDAAACRILTELRAVQRAAAK